MSNPTIRLKGLKLILKHNTRELDRCFIQFTNGNLSVAAYFNQCEYINTTTLNAIRKLSAREVQLVTAQP